ncbi:MAG: DUF1003 domain-containing protein [Hyphomicrobiales bacterium]|nr:DUF1003 domain-containing protein [Hyphomicrobiales bacterium]
MPDPRDVPPHVEETVAAIAELHAAHYRKAAAAQRFVTFATATFARPGTLGVLAIAIAAWLALNIWLEAHGGPAPDPFPFPLLSLMVSSLALFVATMVLIAQRHDDELATRREQLTLELAILAERKTAKIIALLDEIRLNDPHQSDERDHVAEALAEPADPQVVLEAIRAAHEAEPGRETGDASEGRPLDNSS